MLIAAFFSWWYGAGWRGQADKIKISLMKINDYFSVPLLMKTLFAPFRQISAGGTGSRALGDKMRAALDKLFSRLIGAFMRTIMILVGMILTILLAIIGLLRLVFWPLVPLVPVAGVILMMTGWMPWIAWM